MRFSLTFADWWPNVLKLAMTAPNAQPVIAHPSAPSTANQEAAKPAKYKRHRATLESQYLDLLMIENVIPSDTYFNKLWGAKNGTLSSMRSRLKKLGFVFESAHGGWIVTKRPEHRPDSYRLTPKPKPPEPVPVITPSPDPAVQFALITDEAPSELKGLSDTYSTLRTFCACKIIS